MFCSDVLMMPTGGLLICFCEDAANALTEPAGIEHRHEALCKDLLGGDI
ncbi:MAG TPA: hypothetical protein VJ717_19230 [Gemmatimonadaceae bacterium]|nr:hypothetical protein [Gemmatimonadaceae bacterium]